MPKKEIILDFSSELELNFIEKHHNISDNCSVLASNTLFNFENIDDNQTAIINLKRINDFKDINNYFSAINHKLSHDGIFINFAETYIVRKKRILHKYPKPFNWIYYIGDVFVTRITPKLYLTQKLYYYLSGGKGKVLSKTEVLGRLYYAGFKVIDEQIINDKLYFVAQKVAEPKDKSIVPSFRFFIKLTRIGYKGNVIKVYKLRTMHPYSEFIQEYVYEKNSLKSGGKLSNDFRISTAGKFFRKYWIDELPMLINLLKGEMKIIGVRPLSAHYLSLYNPELVALRTQTKPGLLPPFYADSPKTLDEIMDSEKKYLLQYLKSPFKTDVKYFFKILHTIFIKGKRSS